MGVGIGGWLSVGIEYMQTHLLIRCRRRRSFANIANNGNNNKGIHSLFTFIVELSALYVVGTYNKMFHELG